MTAKNRPSKKNPTEKRHGTSAQNASKAFVLDSWLSRETFVSASPGAKPNDLEANWNKGWTSGGKDE